MVKSVPVSLTINPVTQVADVEVKRASTKLILPSVVAAGSDNNIAPKIIKMIKLATSVRDGWTLNLPIFLLISVNTPTRLKIRNILAKNTPAPYASTMPSGLNKGANKAWFQFEPVLRKKRKNRKEADRVT